MHGDLDKETGNLRAPTRADSIPSLPLDKIARGFNSTAAFGQTGSLRAPTRAGKSPRGLRENSWMDLIHSQPSKRLAAFGRTATCLSAGKFANG